MGETMKGEAVVQLENERVRVTRWTLAPDATTGHHRHAFAYVVVPLTSGDLVLDGPDGRTTSHVEAGESYFREAGVEHDVRNVSDHDLIFVETELKDTPVEGA